MITRWADLCSSANQITKAAFAREVIDSSVTDQWVTLNCSFCYLCGLLAYCRVWDFEPSHDLPYGLRTCVAVTAFEDHGSRCDVVGRLLHISGTENTFCVLRAYLSDLRDSIQRRGRQIPFYPANLCKRVGRMDMPTKMN